MRKYKNNFTPKVIVKNQVSKKHPEKNQENPKKQYSMGYSMQSIKRIRVFLKYLTLLYPGIGMNDQQIRTDSDGVPRIPDKLIDAFFNSLDDEEEIFALPEYWELESYGEPNLQGRGKVKRSYDNIPFNKNVLIPLRSLSKNIRATL